MRDRHQALNRAVNRLAAYAEKHLPPDWEITLRFARDESSMELIDPEGDDVATYEGFGEACRDAADHDPEYRA